MALRRKVDQSHCPRPQDYKENSIQIDLSEMNKIINIVNLTSNGIDEYGSITAVVDVQAMMSMEDLVDALLPLGMIPVVVPEFKGPNDFENYSNSIIVFPSEINRFDIFAL